MVFQQALSAIDPVTMFLLIMAGILGIGILGEVIFKKTKIPDVLWLVIIGAILGPGLSIVKRETILGLAPFFAALALIIILFEGGLHLRISDIIKAAPRGVLLAIVGFLLSAAAVTGITMFLSQIGYLPNWSLYNGLLLGSIIGGSSSLIIIPAMRLAKLRENVSTILNIESATTDALCVVVVIALIQFILNPQLGAWAVMQAIAGSFSTGAVAGVFAAIFWLWLQRFFKGTEYDYMLTFAFLLLMYVEVEAFGGSPAIAVLFFALVLGNAAQLAKAFNLPEVTFDTAVEVFHKQVSFFVKTFFFAMIGMLLSFDEKSMGLIAIGAGLAILLLVVRFIAVKISTFGTDVTAAEKKLVSFAMPRGLAAAVLALYPASKGMPGSEIFIEIVFPTIIVSILLFTFGMFVFSPKQQSQVNSSTQAGP